MASVLQLKKENYSWINLDLDDLTLDDFVFPPAPNPAEIIRDINDVYQREIHAKMKSAKYNFMQQMQDSFERIDDIYVDWTSEVNLMMTFSNISEILIPDDYAPPQYKGVSSNVTHVLQQEANAYSMTEKVSILVSAFRSNSCRSAKPRLTLVADSLCTLPLLGVHL